MSLQNKRPEKETMLYYCLVGGIRSHKHSSRHGILDNNKYEYAWSMTGG